MDGVIIRNIRPDDAERVAEIEATCFPAAEAAGLAAFKSRIAAFPEYFLVAETDGKLIGFINGCATDSDVVFDELFHDTHLHMPNGKNLTIFGLDVIPEYQKRGIAALLMKCFIQVAKETGKQKLLLTCKDRLVPYYESFGYVNDGVSGSTHGGSQWFDLTLNL